MPKNKRHNVQKGGKQSELVRFFRPTKLKILAASLLYFSNFVSFFGLIFNYPIYVLFYWGKPPPAGFEGLVAFVVHIAYLYLLACIIARLLK